MPLTIHVSHFPNDHHAVGRIQPSEGPREVCGSVRFAAVAGLFLALGGCVSTADQVSAEIETHRAACRQLTFRTNIERARCHNAAEVRLGEVWGTDLVTVRWQTRLVIAEKTDRKQLTEAEGELEFAKVNADLTSQATRRRQTQQLAEAQYESALAQRRSQRAAQSQSAPLGNFECVTRPSAGDIRTECRDSAAIYIRNNPAIQYP